MRCVLCHMEETYQHNGKKTVYKHDKNVTAFLCSNCTQRLLQMPQSKIIDAYHLAIEKGYLEKASMLLTFIDEEKEKLHDSETREVRPDIIRKNLCEWLSLPTTKSGRSRQLSNWIRGGLKYIEKSERRYFFEQDVIEYLWSRYDRAETN